MASCDLSSYGLCRVAAVSPALLVADVRHNAAQIMACASAAAAGGATLIVCPELSLTAHSCGDLFLDTRLRQETERTLCELAEQTASLGAGVSLVVGAPLQIGPRLYNCAVVLRQGQVAGVVPKTFLPNYGEFYEMRWFSPARLLTQRSFLLGGREVPVGTDLLFTLATDAGGRERYFGIEICEDLWAVQPPSGALAAAGALVLVNPSASTEQLGKSTYRRELVCQQSARCLAAYVYAGSGTGESSTDVVYSGHCMIAENGTLLAEGERFGFGDRMVFADIDLEALEHERLRNTSFAEAGASCRAAAAQGEGSDGGFRFIGTASSQAGEKAGAFSQPAAKRLAAGRASAVNAPSSRAKALGIFAASTAKTAAHSASKNFVGNGGGKLRQDASAFPLPAAGALLRPNPPLPFVPEDSDSRDAHCEEIFAIQQTALARRIRQLGQGAGVVIGVSGGLDSTLALLVCIRAFDLLGIARKRILAVTMPGFGTTKRTRTNADILMAELGVTARTISIEAAVRQHFADIGHDAQHHDIVFENAQARERTQILMNLANQQNALVVGTGDLSESALGWSTYAGDHISMYHVNVGVPKTLVRHLVQWCAQTLFDGCARETLLDIVATPISPELLPPDASGNPQDTEATVGPYELHDFFLYHFVRHGAQPEKIVFYAVRAFGGRYREAVIRRWLGVFFRRFFTQQFKRSCLPDGPKVGSVALSPRGDWRMPSDAAFTLWQQDGGAEAEPAQPAPVRGKAKKNVAVRKAATAKGATASKAIAAKGASVKAKPVRSTDKGKTSPAHTTGKGKAKPAHSTDHGKTAPARSVGKVIAKPSRKAGKDETEPAGTANKGKTASVRSTDKAKEKKSFTKTKTPNPRRK